MTPNTYPWHLDKALHRIRELCQSANNGFEGNTVRAEAVLEHAEAFIATQGWQAPDRDALVAAPVGLRYWVMLANGTGPYLVRLVGQADGKHDLYVTDGVASALQPLGNVAFIQSLYIPEPPK